jgi:hypothetical protein
MTAGCDGGWMMVRDVELREKEDVLEFGWKVGRLEVEKCFGGS